MSEIHGVFSNMFFTYKFWEETKSSNNSLYFLGVLEAPNQWLDGNFLCLDLKLLLNILWFILRLEWNLAPGKFPRIHKEPQQSPYAIVESLPELIFHCNHIDGYLNYHHRTFNQQLVEANAKIHS